MGRKPSGELRGNAGRLYDFSGLEEVDATVNGLMARDEDPFVVRLPRQPGQKDARYAHLLAGQPDISEQADAPAPVRARARDTDRIATLEAEVETLKLQVGELREQFEGFKKQFE